MSVNKFIGPSVALFLDSLVVAAGGWFFWLVISKFISAEEVGQATTVFSLVVLITTLTQLGLEYPLLKKSSNQRSRILGSALVIELLITVAAIPIVYYLLTNLYEESLQSFTLIAILMIIILPLGFVSRFVLLGISQAKSVFVIDVISTGTKFFVGYILVTMQFGAFGVLVAFLSYALVVAGANLFLAIKKFGFGLDREMKFIKEVLRDGLFNMPSKLSGMLIFSLSVILLASFGIASSEIGVFYVSLMISIVGGGLVSSMAYMVIPASYISKTDLSLGSMRIGLGFTAPIIVALVTSPRLILSLVGTEYLSGEDILLVLSIGILPFSVVMNTISRLNYLGQSRKLLYIGFIQILTFLLSLSLFVPSYGTLGAAFSILISFCASFILSVIWSERVLLKYIAYSAIAITLGWTLGSIVGYSISSVSENSFLNQIAVLVTSTTVTFVVIILLKNMSIKEITELLKIKRPSGANLTD
jgi:O-antigen/teichoic acid export membrane protein